MRKALLLALLFALPAAAQVPVALSPVPRMQFFDPSGRPLAGGLVYTYNAGTTMPAPTYVDSIGLIQNTNPILLDSGGFASIWIGAQAYKFVVKTAAGTQIWMVDNIQTAVQPFATNNNWTGVNTFNGVTNILGGGNIVGTFTGGPTFSGSLIFSGLPVFSGIPSFTGVPVFTGIPAFTVSSSVVVPNLNASLLLGQSWAAPGAIGSITPSTGAFTTLTVSGLPITGASQQIIQGCSNSTQITTNANTAAIQNFNPQCSVAAPALNILNRVVHYKASGTWQVLSNPTTVHIGDPAAMSDGFIVTANGVPLNWNADITCIVHAVGTGGFAQGNMYCHATFVGQLTATTYQTVPNAYLDGENLFSGNSSFGLAIKFDSASASNIGVLNDIEFDTVN